MINPKSLYWKGKLLQDMSREELIEAMGQAYEMIESARKETKDVLGFLKLVNKSRKQEEKTQEKLSPEDLFNTGLGYPTKKGY